MTRKESRWCDVVIVVVIGQLAKSRNHFLFILISKHGHVTLTTTWLSDNRLFFLNSHHAHLHSRAKAATSCKLGHRRYFSLSSFISTLSPLIVAHRTRQLESWLSDTLAAFRNRHERQLAYIPHLVRGLTMAELGDKYDGDVQAALRGLQKERLAVDVAPIDRNAMKRKWAPAPEEETDTRLEGQGKNLESNHTRAAKNRE